MEQFHTTLSSLESQKKVELGRQQAQLRRNQNRQEEIRNELMKLEEEEKQLTHEIQTIQKGLLRSSEARGEADKEIEEWKTKIKGLERRTDTALSIMTHMKGLLNNNW